MLFLREHERMPYAEIGFLLGVGAATAAAITSRAREALSAPYHWYDVRAAYRERFGIVRAPGNARRALRTAREQSNIR